MFRVLTTPYKDINQELVEACKQGDRKAQYKIYKLYSRAMYNICMRITNNADDAEDVLQEAFIDAFRKLHTFKGEATFGAWLKRIVINRAINHVKKKRLPLVSVDEMDFRDDSNEGPGSDDGIQMQVEQVHEAIQNLPDGFRTVLTLYLLEGYDHREISEIMGISESTSKSQFNRAKKKLVKMINLS